MTQLEGFPAVSSSHGTWSSLSAAGCVSSPAPQQSPAPSSCQSIRCLLTGASKPAGIKDFAWFNFYTILSDISVDLLNVLGKILARISARKVTEKRLFRHYVAVRLSVPDPWRFHTDLDPYHSFTDSDPDPALFFSSLQDANKNNFFV